MRQALGRKLYRRRELLLRVGKYPSRAVSGRGMKGGMYE
jgi:hypothetical protein